MWVISGKRGEDNGTHACKRGKLVALRITARSRVDVETWCHCGEPNDYTDLPTLTVTCACVSLACVFTCDLLQPSQRASSPLLTHVYLCVFLNPRVVA